MKAFGLKWMAFVIFVKDVWDNFNASGSSSFILAKKLNILKSKLKEWNRDVFSHLDTELGALLNKVMLDTKEQLESLSSAERLERLEVKKELYLVRKRLDTF